MNLALQGSKVARPRGKFQACNAYRYKFFKVPWFQDLMTHEAALHIKQRKMQTNKNKIQTKSASFVEASGKVTGKLPARNSCEVSSKGFLFWNPVIPEL